MKLSLQTCLLLSFFGLLASPVYSMEFVSSKSSTTSLEGIMSRNIAYSDSFADSSNSPFTTPDSLDLLTTVNLSLEENDNITLDSTFSLASENSGEPPTSSIQLPLFQF